MPSIGDELISKEEYRPYPIKKYKIVGETKQSWLLNEIYSSSLSNFEIKISKKELKQNLHGHGYKQFYTAESWGEKQFRDKHIPEIRKFIERSYYIKTETIRKIIEIIKEN